MSDEVEASATEVAIGIVRRSDAVLVRRRLPGQALEGLWEFPGGKCEPGETPERAVARECLEETGLEVLCVRLRRRVAHDYPHGRVVLNFFDCEAREAGAEPARSTGFRWVRVTELRSLRFPEVNGPILEELRREVVGTEPEATAPPL